MAQPRPFNRITSYTDYSAANPSRQQPGAQLDAEFDGVKATTDDIRTNLALIQRDDGKLASEAVGMDQLAPDAVAYLGATGSAETIAAITEMGSVATEAAEAAGTAKDAAEAVRPLLASKTLAALSAMTIPEDITSLGVSGALEVGDASAGMPLVYDEAVDAAYVSAHPDTSFLDAGGRGFRQARRLAADVDAADGNTVQDNLEHGGWFKQAGTGAVERNSQDKHREVVSIADFGGTPVAQLKAAAAELSNRGGGVLFIPRGSYSLDSAELTKGITLTGNITVEGNGSTFTITGTTQTDCVFRATDVSNVAILNMSVVGNNKSSGYNNGAFFNYTHSAASTADMRNITVDGVHLENFAAPRWIAILNLSATYANRNITVSNIHAVSAPGNCIGPSSISYNAAVVYIAGDSNTAGCVTQNVHVSNVYVEGTYIKQGVFLQYGVYDAVIENCTLINCGVDSSISDDVGSYAITVYDTYGSNYNVTIRSCTLSARSCGIYTVGSNNISIDNVRVIGQTDNTTTTLPKGAFAFNGPNLFRLTNCRVSNCNIGLMIGGTSLFPRYDVSVDNLQCYDTVARPLYIKPSGTESGIAISNSRFVATGAKCAQIDVSDSASTILSDLTVSNCYFESTAASSYGFDAFALGENTASDNWKFDQCMFIGTSIGMRIRQMSGRLEVKRSRSNCVGTAQCYQLASSTNIHLRDLEAATGSGGVAFALTSATGTIGGTTRVISGTTAVQGLGSTTPTHSGSKGDYVAAIDYTPAASGAGQTQTIGWRCQGGTTWRPVSETLAA